MLGAPTISYAARHAAYGWRRMAARLAVKTAQQYAETVGSEYLPSSARSGGDQDEVREGASAGDQWEIRGDRTHAEEAEQLLRTSGQLA